MENTGSSSVDVTYSVSPVSGNGCRGDTITITITVDPEADVDAGSLSYALCSNSDLALADLSASISGSATDGSWTTSGDGSFVDGSEMADNSFSGAVTYKPGTGDIENGTVTFTLTVPATSTCPAYDDTVTITINNVSCSEFPWNGN